MTTLSPRLPLKRESANHQPCLADGCDGNAHWRAGGSKRYCKKHYLRLYRHGDALAGNISKGEARRFYDEVVLNYDGDDCLIWPYARKGNGYATIWRDGKQRYASRCVCEDTHGAPPTPRHEGAHSCGNGHLGCVTPKHLRWATPSENRMDRVQHGTDNRGEKHPSSKLTADQVVEIRSKQGIISQGKLAIEYGVSSGTISRIFLREAWAWL